jgi:hypothetical protein
MASQWTHSELVATSGAAVRLPGEVSRWPSTACSAITRLFTRLLGRGHALYGFTQFPGPPSRAGIGELGGRQGSHNPMKSELRLTAPTDR